MPTLVALIGLPGAGKSELARAIAAEKKWPIVNRDSFPRDPFDDDGKAAATEAAFTALKEGLLQGRSCILDGMTLSSSEQRSRVRDIARDCAAQAILVWLDCPVGVAIARVAAQADHPARDRSAALVREVAVRFMPPERDVLRLDALRATSELLVKLLPRL